MPVVTVNGIRLNYEDAGSGEPVILIMGTGGRGSAWHMHQAPALTDAGYRVITFDNRGTPLSDECAEGFTVQDMADDVAALIEVLRLPRVRLVGTSLGAYVAQELALLRPELIHQMVLMATRGRSDTMRSAMARAELELYDSGLELPPGFHAVVKAMQFLSPRTLDDDAAMADWLDLFEMTMQQGPGLRAQLALEPMPDRLEAYREIAVPCHVIAFADDVVTPPSAGRELAEAIPAASFELVEGAGHYGYLERPETVNDSVLKFFGSARTL
jgi:pimeloyl-ACP methyl ester carboxylesterase